MARKKLGGRSKPDRHYWLGRLRRDRPDLAARVEAGELSVHAAAIAAGWRKPRDTPRTALETPRPGLAHLVWPGYLDAEGWAQPPGRSSRPVVGRIEPVGWLIVGIDGALAQSADPRWLGETDVPACLLRPRRDGGGFEVHPDMVPVFDAPAEPLRPVQDDRGLPGCDVPAVVLLDDRAAGELLGAYERHWQQTRNERERLVEARNAARELQERARHAEQERARRDQEYRDWAWSDLSRDGVLRALAREYWVRVEILERQAESFDRLAGADADDRRRGELEGRARECRREAGVAAEKARHHCRIEMEYEREARENPAWDREYDRSTNPLATYYEQQARRHRRRAEDRERWAEETADETRRRDYEDEARKNRQKAENFERQARSSWSYDWSAFGGRARGDDYTGAVSTARHAADAHLLGVGWPCTEPELKAAYRGLQKEVHPDRHPPGERAERTRESALVNDAYKRLLRAIRSRQPAA